MRISIMQPTYLPWAGNFAMMALSDYYIFLDDVQFMKRSWQIRNRVLLNGKEHFLTVPVQKATQGTIISEICIADDVKWRRKHIETIRTAYSAAPYFKEMIESIEDIIGCGEILRLSDLNARLIMSIAERLNIHTKFGFSSNLSLTGKKSWRLLQICQQYRAQSYLAAQGSREYILEEGAFSGTGVDLEFLCFEPRPYPQLKTQNFFERMSILDLIANVGYAAASRYVLNAEARKT